MKDDIFTCFIEFPSHECFTAEIVIAPEDTEVSLGNMIFLTCVAMGTPTPEIFWTFNGVIISNDTNNKTLVHSQLVYEGGFTFISSMLEICSVAVSDMGEYSCIATDGETNATAFFKLTVVDFGKNYPKQGIMPQFFIGNMGYIKMGAL